MRSGNFWYVADMPFSYIGPRDRYLVFADLLHDMLGVQHAESHKALVRLEDVGAMVSVTAMKKLTDYLYAQAHPVLGRHHSATTSTRWAPTTAACAQDVPLSQATNLKNVAGLRAARAAPRS